MAKKITIRDVAREAGVSVATVSYVMNNKKDAKISEETRKKVLQVANLLNYRPSSVAASLSTGKSHIIGIAYHLLQNAPSRSVEIMGMINLLSERFCRMGYNALLIPIANDCPQDKTIHGMDGIIAIDLSEEEFRQMSGNYMIPILCIDMRIHDFLFYQIYSDADLILSQIASVFETDFVLAWEGYNNKKYEEYLFSIVHEDRRFIFPKCADDAHDLSRQNVAVFGELLAIRMLDYIPAKNLVVICQGEQHLPLPKEVQIISLEQEKKANLAMNIMLNALEKKFDVTHEYRVAPEWVTTPLK